jgi:hypothetical protein
MSIYFSTTNHNNISRKKMMMTTITINNTCIPIFLFKQCLAILHNCIICIFDWDEIIQKITRNNNNNLIILNTPKKQQPQHINHLFFFANNNITSHDMIMGLASARQMTNWTAPTCNSLKLTNLF